MLRVCRVTGVGIHDELRIGEMLDEQQRVDRHDDHVLVPMYDECRLMDLLQHCKTVAREPYPIPAEPLFRRRLSSRHRPVAIRNAPLHALEVGAARRLAGLARAESAVRA